MASPKLTDTPGSSPHRVVFLFDEQDPTRTTVTVIKDRIRRHATGVSLQFMAVLWGAWLIYDPEALLRERSIHGAVYDATNAGWVWGVWLMLSLSLFIFGVVRGTSGHRQAGLAVGMSAWAFAGYLQWSSGGYTPSPIAMVLTYFYAMNVDPDDSLHRAW